MNKTKNFVAIITLIVFLFIAGFAIYKWIKFNAIDAGSILFSFLALAYLLNWLNWGQGEKEKDELDRHIETKVLRLVIMY